MVSFDAASSCDPDGGSIQSYHWNFGNGVTRTTSQDSTSEILPSGYNTVSLTVTDDEGATNTTYQAIYVEGPGGCTVSFSICP